MIKSISVGRKNNNHTHRHISVSNELYRELLRLGKKYEPGRPLSVAEVVQVLVNKENIRCAEWWEE